MIMIVEDFMWVCASIAILVAILNYPKQVDKKNDKDHSVDTVIATLKSYGIIGSCMTVWRFLCSILLTGVAGMAMGIVPLAFTNLPLAPDIPKLIIVGVEIGAGQFLFAILAGFIGSQESLNKIATRFGFGKEDIKDITSKTLEEMENEKLQNGENGEDNE